MSGQSAVDGAAGGGAAGDGGAGGGGVGGGGAARGGAAAGGPVRRLLRLARPVSGRLLLACVLGAMAIGSSVGLLAVSAWLISRASQQPPILTLEVAIVAVRAFGLGRAVFRYGERIVSHDAAFRTLTDLRVAIYARLAANGPVALRPYRRGDLLSRSVNDVDAVQDLSLRVIVPSVAGFLVGAASVALAVWLLPAAGAILALALLVGGLVVPWLVARFGAASSRRVAPAKGLLAAEVVDVLAASADIASCGARDRVLTQVAQADDALTAAENRNSGAAGLAAGLGALATGAAVVGAVLVAVPAVRSGQLAGVNLAVVVLLPLAAFEAVLAMPTAALALVSVRQAASRIFALTDAPAAVHEAEHPVALPAASDQPNGQVVMAGVSAAYPDGPDDAISDISLRLAPGRRTALIGPSGSGKSTVAAVLERFLDYRGSIRLDGVELREADSDQVRAIVGSCGQDAHIFDNTIGENVRLARRSATDEEVLAALDEARLGDWVRSLPSGLETPVGAHGAALSGGQRQRVALARALLADFDVLLLDEPTEHLDGPTADRLMADLRAVTADKATLVITHREQDLVGCDDVVAIEDGRLSRSDSPPSRDAGRLSGGDGQVGQ